MDLEILKKQNRLTINDDGLVYIRPINVNNFITYPLDDFKGCLAITPEDYVLLKAGYYRFNIDLTELEINN